MTLLAQYALGSRGGAVRSTLLALATQLTNFFALLIDFAVYLTVLTSYTSVGVSLATTTEAVVAVGAMALAVFETNTAPLIITAKAAMKLNIFLIIDLPSFKGCLGGTSATRPLWARFIIYSYLCYTQ
ncbi:MAG: hypothetical protein R3B12_04600 [Candidatus Saccharimonadales bacterium]